MFDRKSALFWVGSIILHSYKHSTKILKLVYYFFKLFVLWGSLLRIGTDCGLRFNLHQGQRDFSFSHCIETSSGAYAACCPVGTVGPFPGGRMTRA